MDTISSASGRRLKPGRRTRRNAEPSSPIPSTIAPPTTVIDLSSARLASLQTATGQARELAAAEAPPSSLSDVLVEPRPPELDLDPLLHDIAPTGDLIAELWGLDSADTSTPSWRASDVDQELVGSDRPRWRLWAMLALVAAALGWVLGGFLGNGTDLSARVSADAFTLSEAVDRLQTHATDLADGAIEAPLELGEALSEVDRSARALFSSAAQLEDADTASLRIASSDLAALALTVETALADLAGYGSAVDRVTVPPDLPAVADGSALPEITEEVAGWITAQRDEIAMLPRNDLTDAHRETMTSFADGLSNWQVGYLDALRNGDEALATGFISDLESDLETLGSEWRTAAADGAEWISAQLVDLRTQAAGISPGS